MPLNNSYQKDNGVEWMNNCKNLENCFFFREYNNDPSRRLALRGFVNIYCQGSRQHKCIRKKISKKLGGPQNVPCNMMPNGSPLSGTSRDDWTEDVFQVLDEEQVVFYRPRRPITN